MHVAIVHHPVGSGSSIADRDVFDQIGLIETALLSASHSITRYELDEDLKVLDDLSSRLRADAVFNLVESYRGRDRWMHIPAERMDALGLAYTGAPASTLKVVNDKHAAKLHMRASGIATASWLALTSEDCDNLDVEPDSDLIVEDWPTSSESEFIIKSRFEHASVNLEQDAVGKYNSKVDLQRALVERSKFLGPCLAERFIDGREFNLSLLEIGGIACVMPPAEIEFQDFPANQHRIVGYRAKWVEDSFEYNATPRRFLAAGEETELVERLESIALKCWSIFRLRGYARVDFRIDNMGQPWVLEINANPCIAPWSGFTAACAQKGIDPTEFVTSILTAALQ